MIRARKTSLENTLYFVTIPSCLNDVMLAKYAPTGLEEKNCCLLKFHTVVLRMTARNYSKLRAARAARLFFLIQTIEFLISGFINANARTGREGREARAKQGRRQQQRRRQKTMI